MNLVPMSPGAIYGGLFWGGFGVFPPRGPLPCPPKKGLSGGPPPPKILGGGPKNYLVLNFPSPKKNFGPPLGPGKKKKFLLKKRNGGPPPPVFAPKQKEKKKTRFFFLLGPKIPVFFGFKSKIYFGGKKKNKQKTAF